MLELPYHLGDCIAEGSSSHVYNLLGHPEFVLKTLDSKTGNIPLQVNISAAKEIMKRQEVLPDEVSLAKIVEVGIKNGFAAVIVERAAGSPIYENNSYYGQWSARVKEFAEAPQEMYDKAVSDAKLILATQLMIDLSPQNLFYDPKFGITFIDVNKGYQVPSLRIPFTLYPVLRSQEAHLSTSEDSTNLEAITRKLVLARDFDPKLIQI